jgi:hypothetical protein
LPKQGDQTSRLFILGSVLKITEEAQFFWLLFHCASYVLFLQIIGWATFWATFSQTHLFTLLLNTRLEKEDIL